MSETVSTEEILHRMRSHVDSLNQGSQSNSQLQSSVNGAVAPVEGGPAMVPPPTYGGRDFGAISFEINRALEATRQVGQVNPRPAGLHNDVIQFLKKVMRRSLSWYTRPIHAFQGAVIRALEQTLITFRGQDDQLQSLAQDLRRQSESLIHATKHTEHIGSQLSSMLAGLTNDNAQLSRQFESSRQDLIARHESIADELGWLRAAEGRLQAEVREVKLDGRLRDRDWRRVLYDVQSGTLPLKPATKAAFERATATTKDGDGFDYFRFEEMYRGDEALIKKRQQEYLELFRNRDHVVDIGCGRGEFLELLRAHGIRAQGVELGTDQFLLCREKNLDVVQEDLFEYLTNLPDGSLGGIFSAQVIEHLPAEGQLMFIALAYAKTSPGSPVVIETINAQSVFALTRNFLLDPTHIRPVHPEMLKFAMQSAKFREVELRFSSPMTEPRIPVLPVDFSNRRVNEFNRTIEGLNDLIWGYLDYAAIGWR